MIPIAEPTERLSPGSHRPDAVAAGQFATIALRLFLTCWLVYSLHLATNTVREIFLTLSIADHLSFEVSEYANLHPDLFEKPGYGWHIGANPGASMIAAIPYALCRPLVDPIVRRVNLARAASGAEPPEYKSPWPKVRQFFQESWRRGYDIKFGLASLITQSLCMAPISAVGVVAMFWFLLRLTASAGLSLWLALLYAFGTPVFFRTGYLNHNLMIGHFALLGFLALSTEFGPRLAPSQRCFLAGICGGAALLLDYSGVVFLSGLFLYAVLEPWPSTEGAFRRAVLYLAGAIGPIALLWFYQWQSFGNPFLPGQHWMPPVKWIDIGYQGFGMPQADLLRMLAIDYRFGLFTTCPLFLLAFLAPRYRALRRLELCLILGLPLGLWLFCGGISYTRLQFNSGIRYLAPAFPFLFAAAAIPLSRMSSRTRALITILSVAQAWSMAMHRDVERGLGVLDPVLHVFLGGFKLPVLTVLSRMNVLGEHTADGVSPLPLFALVAALLAVLWKDVWLPAARRRI